MQKEWTESIYHIGNANRAYDFESCKARILDAIQYPTGGYTEFVYEPNTFIDYFIPARDQINTNSLTKSIQIYDDNSFFAPDDLYPSPKNKRFNIMRNNTKVKVIIWLRRGSDNKTKISWSDMANFKAYIVQGPNVKIDLSEELKRNCYSQHIKESNQGENKIDELSFEETITLDEMNGIVAVDLPDAFGDQSKHLYDRGARIYISLSYVKDEYKDRMECIGAGLRIKEINHYDSEYKKNKLKYTHYKYTNPITNLSSGILQNKIRFYNYYSGIYNVIALQSWDACHKIYYNSSAFVSDKVEFTSGNCITDPYRHNPNVGYTFVKEIYKSSNDSIGYTLYHFHNEEPRVHPLSIKLTSPINGKALKKTYYDMQNRIKKDENYSYNKKILDYYSGINYFDNLCFMPITYTHNNYLSLNKTRNNSGIYYYAVCGNGDLLLRVPYFNDLVF